jgi:Aldehyde dehydrogenase family
MTVLRKMRTDEVALRKARMLIGGNWVDSASGEVLEVEDPAHRRPIAEVPRGGAEDVARAVQAAADAFPAWSRTIPRERGRLLARIADALEARVEELARTISESARALPEFSNEKKVPGENLNPNLQNSRAAGWKSAASAPPPGTSSRRLLTATLALAFQRRPPVALLDSLLGYIRSP